MGGGLRSTGNYREGRTQMMIWKHIVRLENPAWAGKSENHPPRFLDVETYQWQYSVWVVGVESRESRNTEWGKFSFSLYESMASFYFFTFNFIILKYLFIYLAALGVSCSSQDFLGFFFSVSLCKLFSEFSLSAAQLDLWNFNSPARDWTWTLVSESLEVS